MPYASLVAYIDKQNKALADNPELAAGLGHTSFPTDPEQLTVEQAYTLLDHIKTEYDMAPRFLCEHHLAAHMELLTGALDDLQALGEKKAAEERAAG